MSLKKKSEEIVVDSAEYLNSPAAGRNFHESVFLR